MFSRNADDKEVRAMLNGSSYVVLSEPPPLTPRQFIELLSLKVERLENLVDNQAEELRLQAEELRLLKKEYTKWRPHTTICCGRKTIR